MGCCSLQTRVHLALLFTNSVWGIGAVVGAIGMSTTHPLAFLTIRQFLSGLILLLGDYFWVKGRSSYKNKKDTLSPTSKRSKASGGTFSFHLKTYGKTCALLGLTLFGSQFGFLIGVLFAGPVTGSVWQPSQPIIMAFICVIMGWEVWNSKRMMGVAMAFCGCIIMVILSPHADNALEEEISAETTDGITAATATKSSLFWIGNALLFLNCLCDPSYVLVSKRLLEHDFSPLILTAISNFVSATYMAMATILSLLLVVVMSNNNYNATTTTMVDSLSSIIDDDPIMLWVWIHGSILPPKEALPALFWFVVFSSAGAYGMINWANQYATGTLVMSYTVLQPVSAVVLTVFLLAFHAVRDCTATITTENDAATTATADVGGGGGLCLTPPNMGTFCGMVGVGIGLSLIILTEPKSDGQRKKSDNPTTIPITAGKNQDIKLVPII